MLECQLEKITVFYEIRGEGRPVLMLHGWSIDHRSLMAELELVFQARSGWGRIYPDLPGHGRTPGADWITSQDDIL